jgi:hypothetical protein
MADPRRDSGVNDDVDPGGNESRRSLRLQYSWDWFSFHADQRLRAFNFFILIVAGVIAASAQVAVARLKLLGVAIGLFGSLSSLVFLALEVRNHLLVGYGREILAEIEADLGIHLVSRSRQSPRVWRHGLWLRLFISMSGLGSLAFSVWAAAGYPGR